MGLQVGAIDNNLQPHTAVGDTTNVASRFQNIAVLGPIVIFEVMHRLVEGYSFSWQSVSQREDRADVCVVGTWGAGGPNTVRGGI